MSFSLKQKFVAFSAVTLLLNVGLLIQTQQGHVKTAHYFNASQVASTALSNFQTGDMMHDAIHSNVLQAIIAANAQDIAALKDIEQDYQGNAETFLKTIADNEALPLPENIERKIHEIKPTLQKYIGATATFLEAAKRNPEGAAAAYPAFKEIFEKLVVLQEELATYIEKNAIGTVATQLSEQTNTEKTLEMLGIGALLLTAALPLYALFALFAPLKKITGCMSELAEGHNDIRIPFASKQDEIGSIAQALSIFKQNAQEKIIMEAQQHQQQEQAEADKKRALTELASRFEQNVQNVVDIVASASTQMDSTAQSVVSIISKNASKLSHLNGSISSVNSDVQTVADATSQLSSSISEISQRVSRAASITLNAVSEAKRAESTVGGLVDAAQKIGEVLNLISSITEQINLLALNATIEAARAGDAGKGFAVVASEVKNLAGQTTRATEEIGSYIAAIQNNTNDTATVIKGISDIIYEINEISTTIAAAVEEQGVATQDISHNVQRASVETRNVQESAHDVESSSSETSAAASQMQSAAAELSRQSEGLRGEVSKFLKEVRAA